MRAGCPVGSNGGHEGPPRGLRARLLLAAALCVALSASAHAATPLRTIVEDVPGSTAHSYGTRDNLGNSMHTLKVVKSPFGGYLGVYHTVIGTRFIVKVATSVDLLNWRFAGEPGRGRLAADDPRLKRGAALVAYETHAGCPGAKRCLVLRHYATESALLSGAATRSVILPRTLSSCAEGTPNIFSATSNLTTVDIGFHYFQDCRVDRQARGTLRRLRPGDVGPGRDAGRRRRHPGRGREPDGMIGDRDGGSYDGYYHRLIEGQIGPGDFSSWRNFLYTGGTATQLSIRTHGGSQAFANPTFTPLPLPNGEPGVVVTQFVPSSAAAPGRGGRARLLPRRQDPPPAADDRGRRRHLVPEHRLPRRRDVRTAGAGPAHEGADARRQPVRARRAGRTSRSTTRSDWGRVRAITMPTPGNHDPPSSGYGPYFGKPPNYSFDLGAWHLIALDSTGHRGRDRVPRLRPGAERGAALHPRPTGTTRASRRTPRTATTPRSGRSGPGCAAAGADVVLNGHAHTYERFAPQTPTARGRARRASGSSSSAPAARRCTASARCAPTARCGWAASTGCCG